MRKLVRWTAVTLGTLALVRWLRRRRSDTAIKAEAPTQDPADDLRRTLAASRAETADAAEQAAPGAEEQPTASESVDERRAAVHAQGRSALSDMAPGDES